MSYVDDKGGRLMPNMRQDKVPMSEQEPLVRNRNFEEVSQGYTKEQAME